jgi:hypothetical protein
VLLRTVYRESVAPVGLRGVILRVVERERFRAEVKRVGRRRRVDIPGILRCAQDDSGTGNGSGTVVAWKRCG